MASFDNTPSKPMGQGGDASGNRSASTPASPTGERFSSSRHGGGVADDAKEIANDLTEKAKGMAGQAQQAATELGGQFAGAAQKLADSQVKAGANLLQNVSKAATAAARELEGTSPEIGRYVRDAAGSLETFAQDMRERSAGDIFNTFSNFARRQPLTVMVGSIFAGFLITRFLKSSGERYGTMDRSYDRDGSFDRDDSFGREGRSGRSGFEARGGVGSSGGMASGYGSRASEAGASRGGASGEDWRFGSPGRAGSTTSGAGTSGRAPGQSGMTTDGTSGERDGR